MGSNPAAGLVGVHPPGSGFKGGLCEVGSGA